MIRIFSIMLLIAITLAAPSAHACATCFGAEDSPQTQALNMAIITMLGTTYVLFGAMIATAFILWRKSQNEDQNPNDNDLDTTLDSPEMIHG